MGLLHLSMFTRKIQLVALALGTGNGMRLNLNKRQAAQAIAS